ncbi:MAG: DUF3467 domain-containing protein [Planctomycetota bacterium]|jgi:hypothetical protein|nr:DUF3467 domain-containing protein [Planctomycetota bacterium]
MSDKKEKPTVAASKAAPNVKWNDKDMRTSYANVCNVSSSKEEVVFLFGVNQAWHGGVDEVEVQLTDRMIMSPHAAKRMYTLLGNMLQQYEGRFGQL